MRKLLLTLAMGLLGCGAAYGQNGRYDQFALGPRGPIPNASIAVCLQPANTATTPCSPIATIFSTTAGAAQSNPLTADALGNFHFYIAPGIAFTVQLYGPQVQNPFVLSDQQVYLPSVASVNLTSQQANISTTTIYAVPANGAGMYRISCYPVETQAGTMSGTLPSCSVSWTDSDTGVTPSGIIALTETNAGNLVGNIGTFTGGGGLSWGQLVFNAKASTNIQYSTAGYASSGATPMQYAVHIRLEYLGP